MHAALLEHLAEQIGAAIQYGWQRDELRWTSNVAIHFDNPFDPVQIADSALKRRDKFETGYLGECVGLLLGVVHANPPDVQALQILFERQMAGEKTQPPAEAPSV
eukprot:CAMPEP_0174711556 /NCGR_PEP_ID=MMETSP1094-20130205/12839_1 /TAXON_ID=156173 /ORGANISM="Chrysochromulina brevifilum, Strain UTEX LB 985" /LENGTH=104 /DNA_ID=CAMNT_0015910509 /DNA_START=179 /DNA_END=494 /DNA_ORIENTATION=-